MMGGGTTQNMQSSFQIEINCVTLHLVGYILEYIFLQLLSELFFILRRNEREVIKKMFFGVHVKYPLFLSDFNKT